MLFCNVGLISSNCCCFASIAGKLSLIDDHVLAIPLATIGLNPAIAAACNTSPPVTAAIAPPVTADPAALATILARSVLPNASAIGLLINDPASRLTFNALPISGNIGVKPAATILPILPPLSAVTATLDIAVTAASLIPRVSPKAIPSGPKNVVNAAVSIIGNALLTTKSATPPTMSAIALNGLKPDML